MRTLSLLAACISIVCSSKLHGVDVPPIKGAILFYSDDAGNEPFQDPTIGNLPNFNRMLNEGMFFRQWSTPHSICSPSRAAVLTSRLSIRTGVYNNLTTIPPRTGDHRVFHPNSVNGLPPEEITVAETLSQHAGFDTLAVAKWHLGYSYGETTLLPLNQGFTSFVGTPVTHCEGPPSYPAIPLFHNNTIVGRLGIDVDINTQLIYNYTDAATQFIRDHGPGGSREDVPFFIYYALDNTHEQVFYPSNYSGISLRGDFGDAMHAYDWSLGQILDTLAVTGLDAHVPTVYTTDNGGWRAISVDQAGEVGQFSAAWFSSTYGTDDLGKGSTWEGGFRVPGLVRWPGVVPAGTQNLAYANSLDVYPTFVSLAGASMPSGVVHDGVDITALFLGAGAEGGELTEARQAGLTWQEAARRRIARSHGIGSGLAAEDLWADMEGARDGTPVVTGRALKAEADAAVNRKPFMYYRGQHLLAARGAGNMSAYKAHFGTHTGFGHEPIVWHDPPVIFDVEVDPAERSPVTNRPDIIKALTQAAAEHNATLVRGTPLLNEVDYKAMNCKGLTPQQSGCCLKEGGKCST